MTPTVCLQRLHTQGSCQVQDFYPSLPQDPSLQESLIGSVFCITGDIYVTPFPGWYIVCLCFCDPSLCCAGSCGRALAIRAVLGL
jgi:hypothetical protein